MGSSSIYIQQLMERHGVAWIKFDETTPSQVNLSKGNFIATVNGTTVIEGFNGNARRFNGSSDHIQLNGKVIPAGKKSIRFKIKKDNNPSALQVIMENGFASTGHGTRVQVQTNGNIVVTVLRGVSGSFFDIESNYSVCDGTWHDVFITWDGTTDTNAFKIYVDDMDKPKNTGTVGFVQQVDGSNNFTIGRRSDTTADRFLEAELDEIEIYNDVVKPQANKILIQSTKDTVVTYKKYDTSSAEWQDLSIAGEPTEQNYLDDGMNKEDIELIPEEAWRELDGQTISILEYTDNPNQTESIVETETEPFTIYDEFGDTMEVLYYTDDPDKNEAELEATANYSPLDEFDEDFEVVTWTDESSAERAINMTAIPKPHLIKKFSPTTFEGEITQFIASEVSNSTALFFLSEDGDTYKKWNGTDFVPINISDPITDNGMSSAELLSISSEQWKQWTSKEIYLAIYLGENDIVESITLKDSSPKESTYISDARLYILNTVSTINVTFAGSTLSGTVDDEDKGKVQYRVILNGSNYYPSDGSFTSLAPSPLDIDLTLSNKDYLIDQNNTLRVEFKDFWGTVDYWQTNFIGTYSGLLFLDETGEYYSDEIGGILKYLDFGILIAGQTTLEQAIVLRNTYGYPVENISITADRSGFPNGMDVQFGTNDTTFEALPELKYEDVMNDGEEKKFYLRLTSKLGATPPTSGKFDIKVSANRHEPATE